MPSDDFHHVIHACLTGESQGYYADYGRRDDVPRLLEETFIYNGCYSPHRGRRHGAPSQGLPGDRFVVCIQNHDQVGNRATGERLGRLVEPPAQRLAASLLLLAPHLPLFFMGEEYGEEHLFLFFCSFADANLVESIRLGRRQEFEALHAHGEVPDPQAEATFAASCLTWSWASDPHKAGLRQLYQDLLSVRQRWPALRNFTERAARLLPGSAPQAVLELIRGMHTPEGGTAIRVYGNLTHQAQAFTLPCTAAEALLFSSEARKYNGARHTTSMEHLQPYECVVIGPAQWHSLWEA